MTAPATRIPTSESQRLLPTTPPNGSGPPSCTRLNLAAKIAGTASLGIGVATVIGTLGIAASFSAIFFVSGIGLLGLSVCLPRLNNDQSDPQELLTMEVSENRLNVNDDDRMATAPTSRPTTPTCEHMTAQHEPQSTDDDFLGDADTCLLEERGESSNTELPSEGQSGEASFRQATASNDGTDQIEK